MTKSTPINELPSNNESKPLVQDILKEIQNETSTQTQPPPSNIEDITDLHNQQIHQPEQADQHQNALNYQIDPNINLQQPTQPIQQPISHQMTQQVSPQPMNTSVSLSNNILDNLKEPLLVGLITILLSVPAVNNLIMTLSSKFLAKYNYITSILVKAIVAGILFMVVKKLV
jgi:hypothetical protein